MAPKTTNPAGWKNGEQLELLINNWDHYKRAQNSGKLDQFWRRIFAEWAERWPIPHSPPPRLGENRENTRLMLQAEKQTQIKNWYNNRGRGTDSAKVGRNPLKLDVSIDKKRKLAPVQAYCTYAWKSTLRDIVIARWEQQKSTMTLTDDEDPSVDAEDGPGSLEDPPVVSAIPLAFKLKIAKEVYDQLPDEQKVAINTRRANDQNKIFRSPPEIENEEERVAKLRTHQRNQAFIPDSALRVLKNMEDQAGCVTQLLVASVSPTTGAMSIQKFCQGRTEKAKLSFETHYGEEWEANVEQKFGEWAMRVFGDVDTGRRGAFTLPKNPTVLPQNSTDGASSEVPVSVVTAPARSISPPTPAVPSKGSSSRPKPVATKKKTPRPVAPPASQLLPQLPVPEKSIPSSHLPPAEVSNTQPTSTSESASASASIPLAPVNADSPPPSAGVTDNDGVIQTTMAPGVQQPPSQAAVIPETTQALPTATPESLQVVNTTNPISNLSQLPNALSQLSGDPSQFIEVFSQSASNPPQFGINPSQLTTTHPQSTGNKPQLPIPTQPVTPITDAIAIDSAENVRYRVLGQDAALAGVPSRRGSIDGVPEMSINFHASAVVPPPPDLTSEDTREVSVDLSEYISMDDDSEGSHVSSSQKTSDGCGDPLSPPPKSQWRHSAHKRKDDTLSQSSSTPARARIDVNDLPSWMTKKGQWEYIASTPGGPSWKKLLEVYMEQERRLEFSEMGETLTHEGRPIKIKEYFQYAHTPSRGNNLTVPDFGKEVADWWRAIQPEWRRAGGDPPQGSTTWSYVLSGGSKGLFLVVMCLAWWSRAHARHLEDVKSARRTAAEAAGVTVNFDNLLDHSTKWLEIVKDVTFVMENARGCSIPGHRTKRKRESEPSAPRKRSAAKATSRRQSKA